MVSMSIFFFNFLKVYALSLCVGIGTVHCSFFKICLPVDNFKISQQPSS